MWFISGCCDLYVKQSDGVSFVLPAVKAIPGGSGVPSFNGELECHLGLKVRQWAGSQQEVEWS